MREGDRVVRQRVGLLLPCARSDQVPRRQRPVSNNGIRKNTEGTGKAFRVLPCSKGVFNMPKLSIRDLHLQGKRVFTRVDFNVPLSPEGEVQDDTRIRETLPTLRFALEQGATLVL